MTPKLLFYFVPLRCICYRELTVIHGNTKNTQKFYKKIYLKIRTLMANFDRKTLSDRDKNTKFPVPFYLK